MTEYDYTKSPCAIDRLTQEIQQSNIVTSLAHCNLFGDALTIFFNADLSGPDKTTLDAIVAAHSGVPLPSNTPQPVSIQTASVLTTQFERTDLDLKMARIKGSTTNGTITVSLKIPGTFGVDDGRYIAGGYGIMDTYDPDDVLVVWVEDTDRIICAAMGLATDGTADATVQGMGVLPSPLDAFGALPNYPKIKEYADTDVAADNQGWYFYPLAVGNSTPAVGEVEIEPLGFYGHPPSGLYLIFQVVRPNIQTGTLRGDINWGKKE